MTEILTATEVAARLKCHVKSVYELHATGKLIAFKIFDGQKGFRWYAEDVESFILMRSGRRHEPDRQPAPPYTPLNVPEMKRQLRLVNAG